MNKGLIVQCFVNCERIRLIAGKMLQSDERQGFFASNSGLLNSPISIKQPLIERERKREREREERGKISMLRHTTQSKSGLCSPQKDCQLQALSRYS